MQIVPIAVQGPGACTQGQSLPLLTLRSGVLGVVQTFWPRKKKDHAVERLVLVLE